MAIIFRNDKQQRTGAGDRPLFNMIVVLCGLLLFVIGVAIGIYEDRKDKQQRLAHAETRRWSYRKRRK